MADVEEFCGPGEQGIGSELRVDLGRKVIRCGVTAVRARTQVCYLARMLLDGPDRGVTVERALMEFGQRFGTECEERNRLNQLVGELRLAVGPLGWNVERIGGLPAVNLGRVRLTLVEGEPGTAAQQGFAE